MFSPCQQIEKLKTESGSPTTQQRLRSKERALDAKRIQDLERQVGVRDEFLLKHL